MKIRMALIACLFLLATLTISGCHRVIHDRIVGSGVRQTQKRDIGTFTAIETEGAFEIEVTIQKEISLELEGDDNILPRIKTEVRRNVLHISSEGNFSLGDPIRVKITVPNLEAVSASGAGTINVSGLNNEKFRLDVNGAPTVRVSGVTKLAEIETNGAAKIDMHKLRAANAVVDSNGVSRVEVYASEKLDVTISGPSKVIYEGEAEVNQKINGPGSLEKREAEGA